MKHLQVVSLSLFLMSTGGCLASMMVSGLNNGGVGVILFDDKGLTAAPSGVAPTIYDIECVDSFQASGGESALGNQAGTYGVACTYQGQPMPWPIVATFSAAPMANTNARWTKYRSKVVKMATSKHCSAVALRTKWPTKNQEGEAFGAFCVGS